jgi:predicted MFS family arabinose efflux permease
MLLLVGVTGFIGTTLIGGVLEKSLYRPLIVIPLIMAAIGLALMAFGASVPLTAVLLAVWGLVATSAPVGWWTWLARTLPQDAEAGGGLIVAVVQLAIALGATLGGVLFDASGYRASFGLSVAVLVLGAALAWLAARKA